MGWQWYLNKWWARDQLAPFRLYRVLKGHREEMSGIDSILRARVGLANSKTYTVSK